VVAFLFEVGVEQSLVSFATTPEDVVEATQLVVDILSEKGNTRL